MIFLANIFNLSKLLRLLNRNKNIIVGYFYISFPRSAESLDTNGMTLEKALVDSKRAVNLFFNNKFEEARAIMESW